MQVLDLGSLFSNLPPDLQAAVDDTVQSATGFPLPDLPAIDIAKLDASDVQVHHWPACL